LNEKKINPIIKVKRNSVILSRNNIRLGIKKSGSKQKRYPQMEKEKKIYGHTDGWLKLLLSRPSKEYVW